jgi:hypothetical protein
MSPVLVLGHQTRSISHDIGKGYETKKLFGLLLTLALLVALGVTTPISAYDEIIGDKSALYASIQAGSSGGIFFLDSFSLSDSLCPPLSAPTAGDVVTVSSEAELRNQAYNAAAGTTLMISAGTYSMNSYVHVINDGITLRGETGDREDVVLDFGGMESGHFGILVEADDVTIADLTIRNAHDHGVSVQGRDRPKLYNLHIQDIRDQLVKVNPYGDGSEDGLLACSRLEYTASAPDDYTNGISAHDAHGWVVRDNEWYRIRTSTGDPVPTILFWSGSSDTVVERNLLVDCYQGIAFGNSSHGPGDHSGGIVRNNFIYSSLEHDVAIEMTYAQDWLVAHNTVILLNPALGLTWGMEARFSDSQGTFAYNLTNMAIINRDGANGTLTDNVTNAQTSWFVNAAAGDLHLRATATDAIDQAATLDDVPDDFDGDARPIGPAPDVGADEYGVPPPTAVTDLRVTEAITSTGTLTATLRWAAPTNAVTTTLRYSDALVTEANWADAPLLTGTLLGSTEGFTATVSYDDSTVYFALRSQNAEGNWSDLSNNAFWPHLDVFLPFVAKDG